MSPVDNLEARDLEWISDFVMQQMIIMLRPVMDHLQQSDLEVEHTQRMVQQLSMSLSEAQGDVERANKCLAILRQGLGLQNEGKCMLQRDLEGTTKTITRLDEQMESMLKVVKSMEDSVSQQGREVRGLRSRQEELGKQATSNTSLIEEMRAKVEAISVDAHAVKDDLLNSEARLEVWQRELRELRCKYDKTGQGGQAVVDPWVKKGFPGPPDCSASGGADNRLVGTKNFVDTGGSRNSSSQTSKQHINRVSSSGRGGVSQEELDFDVRPRSSSRAVVWGSKVAGGEAEDGSLPGLPGMPPDGSSLGADARLPVLVARRPNMAVAPERAPAEAQRLRFTATLSKPPAHGNSH